MTSPIDTPAPEAARATGAIPFVPSPGMCDGVELARQRTMTSASSSAGGFWMKPYLLGGFIAALVLMLVYQQVQITQLTNEVGLVSDRLKTSDVRTRLDSHDVALREVNTRLSYLDAKVNAVNQKAQVALDKLKAQEDNDIFGNFVKNVKHTFGLQ